jgi:hypothetical protein
MKQLMAAGATKTGVKCMSCRTSLYTARAALPLLLGLAAVLLICSSAWSATGLSAVWGNSGGDKVAQEELRATGNPASVLNTVYDGSSFSLFGAKNEVISLNLILEAGSSGATGVRVTLDSLTGPVGYVITSRAASGEDLFNYVGRNIELFFVRYLQIRGLSVLAYETYDERHIPARCRRSYDEDGWGSGLWTDRQCHDRHYPDIAVPLELAAPFSVAADKSQAVWVDIYIPREAPAGAYTGTVTISENGVDTWSIPVALEVKGFTLPDLPNARTMLYLSPYNINDRYLGATWIDPEGPQWAASKLVINRHYQMAHRHRLSLIEDYHDLTEMEELWVNRLDGSLFTAAQGYAGPGEGVGNNVYSIGTYGSWPWEGQGKAAMWSNSDAWVNWFQGKNFSTPTDYFLYLIDESSDYAQTETWAQWINSNPGPGGNLMSMATAPLPDALANIPSLDLPASSLGVGITSLWDAAADYYRAAAGKTFFLYNGGRPATGCFAIEDDGVALRVLAWSQFKKRVRRWFYWESTYYWNFQCEGWVDAAKTDVFSRAQTYGCYDSDDPVLGQNGWNYYNGDGVLFYPGADLIHPSASYGLMGPFASLRLKTWRRGIQDVDYLTMAAAVDPAATWEVVNRMIPKVLWEYGVQEPSDPTWVRTDISWSTDPDLWEAARLELADLIMAGQARPHDRSWLLMMLDPDGGVLPGGP